MKPIVCLFLMAFFSAGARAATDPFAGTWTLDVPRSTYPAGTGPATMTIEMESAGQGIRYRSDAIFANGRAVHSEYTADYEGNQAIVMGARGMMLPVFLKRIDANTVVASYTKDLTIVATSRRVISDDGRTMTITTNSKDPSGQNTTTIGIFLKM